MTHILSSSLCLSSALLPTHQPPREQSCRNTVGQPSTLICWKKATGRHLPSIHSQFGKLSFSVFFLSLSRALSSLYASLFQRALLPINHNILTYLSISVLVIVLCLFYHLISLLHLYQIRSTMFILFSHLYIQSPMYSLNSSISHPLLFSLLLSVSLSGSPMTLTT